ncbi:hypothetical protein PIB30_089201 [Stylosanthes scabra]|uniref:Leucine-rich repeat-containing N-terminal plant-type domain-containing protein n=1 Tax=Stylosanthes scabra TaxID=79078 RepID=A0ABU6ZSK3_9FABA|nr:hypothetical protein [Stylosanthes scabra]
MGVRCHISIGACALFLLVVAEIAHCANSSLHLHSPCVERERQALVKFKESLNDPLNLLSSWQGIHCCQWEGISCDDVTGRIVKLDLTTSFERCQRSQPFRDHYNFWETYEFEWKLFGGNPIPMFIGSMQQLRYLSLSNAGFVGKIPKSLGNLTNLHFLDLSGNEFSPPLNINLISELRLLEHLDMGNVYFGQAHNLLQPVSINLTGAPKLRCLGLAGNGLTESALDALQNMTSLVHLDLSHNNLISFPSWSVNFKKLESLDLSWCGLFGSIPKCNFH